MAEDAQGASTESHISPSILVYQDKPGGRSGAGRRMMCLSRGFAPTYTGLGMGQRSGWVLVVLGAVC